MLPDPIFTGRNNLPTLGGVAGSDRAPTLPPSAFSDLAAWFRFGMGITVTGAGVSQWDDQSGNGRHLKQGTDANRPGLQSDGSILFDGVAHFLKCDAFTFNQPETLYLLVNPVSWTSADAFCDGNATDSGYVHQITATPNVNIRATGDLLAQVPFSLGAYHVMQVVFNNTASLLQDGSNAPVTGTTGAANMGGFTLAAYGNGIARFGNIRIKEAILCNTAHDGNRRAQMRAWLESL